MQIPYSAFTMRYDGLASVLVREMIIQNVYNNKSIKCRAIWDTGAEKTTIIQEIANNIECIATDQILTKGVGSEPKKVNVYDVSVIDIGTKFRIKNIPVASTSSIGGGDVLIGMDIISLGDLAITNQDKKTHLLFLYIKS